MNNLERIDAVRSRMKCSYQEAKEALEACEGDVVNAIVYLEQQKSQKQTVTVTGENLVETVKNIINEGQVRNILIKDQDGKIVMDIPVLYGAIAAMLVPVLIPLASIVVIGNQYTLELTQREE